MNPKISVIILTWNQADYTVNCVKSVLKQNYKNFDILIIDNGSTDNSIKIYIAEVQTYGTTTYEKSVIMLQETREALFLFKDKEISNYINSLYKKGVDLRSEEHTSELQSH